MGLKNFIQNKVFKFSLPPATEDFWYESLAKFFASRGGSTLDPETALSIGAVYACTNVRAKTIAMFPINIFRREEKKKIKVDGIELQKILTRKPNEVHDSYRFYEYLIRSFILQGNGYAYIERTKTTRRITRLIPLHPEYVKPKRRENGDLIYELRIPGRELQIFLSENIFHFANHSDGDGITGQSAFKIAMDPFLYAQALEQSQTSIFKNGQRPDGVLEFEGRFPTDEAEQTFREKWKEFHGGANNRGQVAILQAGMKYNPISMTNEDAQVVEQLRYSVENIARVMDVPPYRIQDFSNATYNNIEHASLAWARESLLPDIIRLERALEEQILKPMLGDDYYVKFDMDVLLRGDLESRSTYFKNMIFSSVLSPDEVRDEEGFNPREDPFGNDVLIPQNMIPASRLAEQPIGSNDSQASAQGSDQISGAEDQNLRDYREKQALKDVVSRMQSRFSLQCKTRLKKAEGVKSLDIFNEIVNAHMEFCETALFSVSELLAGDAISERWDPLFEQYSEGLKQDFQNLGVDTLELKELTDFFNSELCIQKYTEILYKGLKDGQREKRAA